VESRLRSISVPRSGLRALFADKVLGCALISAFALAADAAAQCREKPTVQMDERTAESHLLEKKDPELPAAASGLVRLRRIVLLVTVDREGTICDVRPLTGPKELRRAAVTVVKKHWKYRPFLVDWKPVVVRFPVSVTFVVPKSGPEMKAKAPETSAPEGQQAA